MGFLDNLFARKPADQPPAGPAVPWANTASSRPGEGSGHQLRRELVQVALRDALRRNGIPEHLLQAEALRAQAADGSAAVYIRLRVLEWDHRLMAHAMAFQQELEKRVMTLDRGAGQWLLGVTWQLALAEGSYRPALPPPQVWQR
ncbi:MAG TPA: hypothetical protein VFE82_17090 [Ramlibacter sp.]|jgi:hypothetical protein|uniref:hypothetical protein n=1 Tax=Ramlibacter sp. TaxID=1917967 RepID=UPI002D2E6AF7|nr:hypothetical protein [Ramlibacter sp.]HZY20189.1 hypothetical protein [Ramlibacter sp.]